LLLFLFFLAAAPGEGLFAIVGRHFDAFLLVLVLADVPAVAGQQSLLLELLAAHAVARPGRRLEPLDRDLRAALLAMSEIAGSDASERFVDEHQLAALEVGQREEEFLGIGVDRVVDVVLGAVVGGGAAVPMVLGGVVGEL